MQVGDTEVLLKFILTVHVDYLAQNAHSANQILGLFWCTLHGNADDNLCTHFSGDVGRIVILQATINQYFIANPYWRECRWYSHRCAHSLRQSAAMKINLTIINDVGCYTSKRNRKIAGKVERISIAGTELLKKLCQIFTLDDATCLQVALADGHTCTIKIGILLLSVANTLTAHTLFVGNNEAPVLHAHYRVERIGVIADGV